MKANLAFVLAIAAGLDLTASAQFTNPITTTPTLVQDGFGPAGDLLPNNGLEYCVPVSVSMSLSYLGVNGFNQIAPATPTASSELNLVEVMSGLIATDPLGGSGYANIEPAVQIYLSAAGISAANYEMTYLNAPTVSQLAALNQPGTVVDLPGGYYNSSGTREGGHCIALVGTGVNELGQSSPNTIVVNDQLPSALTANADIPGNVLQYFRTIPTSGNLTGDGSIEIDPSQYQGQVNASTVAWVVEGAFGLTVNPSQQSINNPTPATWTLSGTQIINLDSGTLPVLAPITGSGGFTLGDYVSGPSAANLFLQAFGNLQLHAADTSTGANTIDSGTWMSTITSGQPFGTGSITIDQGNLALSPTTGSSNISFSAASGAGNTFTYVNGAKITLDLNGNKSLTFTIGGNTDDLTANLIREGTGTLVIAPGGGTSELGDHERVVVNGSADNLPQLTDGIVSPSIVGQNNDSSASGDFLTYGSNGFAKASYIMASYTSIGSAGNGAVFLADTDQTVAANKTVEVYALNVEAVTVGGGASSVLEVGAQSGGQAGVILNGGTISTKDLAFGAAEGLVYTSDAGGAISSVITGSNGLTTFGPGILTLEGANTYTGTTTINSGRLNAKNTSGSATGTGDIDVQTGGTLEISGSSGKAGGTGTTTVSTGAALLLNGGTSAGTLTMSSGSYLLGSGTVAGAATISGVIGNSGTPSALPKYTGVEDLTFTNSVTFNADTIYSWKLDALNTTPTEAGKDWSLLTFDGAFQTASNSIFSIDLDLASTLPNPDSGNAFWNASHQWLIASASSTGAANNFWDDSAASLGAPAYSQGTFSFALMNNGIYIDYTPNTLYWLGGTDGTWTGKNWSSVAAGTSPMTIPTSTNTNDVIFSAKGAANQGNTTLGQDFTIYSLTVSDTKPVVINSGTGGPYTLTIAGLVGTGITVDTGANLTINSNLTLGGGSDTVEVEGTGEAAINGMLGGANGLAKTGLGTLTLSNSGNTYTGGTAISAGILAITSDGDLGDASGGLTLDDGTLQVNATLTTARAVTLVFAGGTIDTADSTAVLLTGIVAGTGALTKTGTGTLTLAGNDTYTGATTVSAGTLQVGNGTTGSLASASAVTIASGATLTLDLGTGGTFSNRVTDNGRLIAAGGLAPNNYTIASSISGSGNLTKNNDNTVTLTHANTYTGATVISDGTLLVDNTTGSGTGTGAVTVNNGATLGGRGTISGAVTLESGGDIDPGAGSPETAGTVLHAGSLRWNGGTLTLQLGSSGDELKLTSGLNIGLGGTYTLDLLDAGITETSYTLLTFASTDFKLAEFTLDLPEGYTGKLVETSTSLKIEDLSDPTVTEDDASPEAPQTDAPQGADFTGTATNDPSAPSSLDIVPSPEPGSAALLALGAGALACRRRRNRAS